MKEIDLENKFVKLVYDYQLGKESVEVCVEELERLEDKHQVTLLVDCLDYKAGENCIEVSKPFEHLMDPQNNQFDELFQNYFFPFLSDTHAVLNSAYPDNGDIVFANKYFYHATARAYAATYAEWAKSIKWLGSENWHYTDFYYSQSLSEVKYSWLKSLYEVIKTKNTQP